MCSWDALHKWDLKFFQTRFKDLEITLNYNLPSTESPYLLSAEGHHKTLTLEQAIDAMSQSDRCYIAQQDISMFRGTDADYDLKTILPQFDKNTKTYTYLWIGKNTQSGLHYDYNDNFLIQIYGHKKVFLVCPADTKYLYPLPENFTKTQVNPCEPNFTQFPKFKYATLWEGELNPGEALFIPKGWFHHIYAPSESISLNCWYGKELSMSRFLLSFYRSGKEVWLQFFKDFFRHGVFKYPVKDRLFCSQPMGKLAYEKMKNAILSR